MDFNRSKKYYKVTSKEEIDKGYQLHDGLNIDTNKWSDLMNFSGGFQFTDIINIFSWTQWEEYFGYWVREVTIPKDETLIYCEGKQIKAHSIILGERKRLFDLDTFKHLISLGANIHVYNDIVFSIAAREGYLDIVKYFVEQDDIDFNNGNHAFSMAAEAGCLEVVKYFVDNGANISAKTAALQCAASEGHLDVVKYLVKHRANVHRDNDFAYRWAYERGRINVAEYLNSLK